MKNLLLLNLFILLIAATSNTHAQTQILSDIPGGKSTKAILRIDQPIISQINHIGDKDWFKLRVRAGGIYLIELQGLELQDSWLRLRNSEGQLLTEDDDGGDNLDSRIIFRPNTDQTIYVIARGFSNGTITVGEKGDRYRLSVSRLQPVKDPSRIRPISRFKGAVTIGVGNSAYGYKRSVEGKHVYKVYLRAGKRYKISLLGSGTGSIDHALSDTLVSVHNAYKKKLAEDDDSGKNLDSYLVITPRKTGIHYIVIKHATDIEESGVYKLSIW